MPEQKIPFKVSARTARLIGSQNFSNAEGAIIELVKNSYDADARKCILIFDNRFAKTPLQLSQEDYDRFKGFHLVRKHYKKQGSAYILELEEHKAGELALEKPDEEKKRIEEIKIELAAFFRSQTKLYIIDNGEGMTDEVIKNHWMVIGTNHKEESVNTRKGRVKTGAKGIGRFALDRLGLKAEMTTKPWEDKYPDASRDIGYLWQVDWNRFEENSASVIDDIKADLIDISLDYVSEVKSAFRKDWLNRSKINLNNFTHGTLIEVSGLKEVWDESSVDKVYSSLEVLVPPVELSRFEIYLFSSNNPEKYGKIQPTICDDFDYKLSAVVDNDGTAEITISRHEHDLQKFTPELFERLAAKNKTCDKTTLKRGSFSFIRSLPQLLPGFKDIDENHALRSIGAFDFTLYFMKFQTAKKDKDRFLYKDFNPSARKSWLDEFGGIKLFRDNFRVRPYGEVKGAAFDWLDLGIRAASSPAGIGKKSGGYRVRPHNVSGIISISRLTNIKFEDKSNREGLQENAVFTVFKQIILSLIEEFENDRSFLGREISAYYDETHRLEVTEEAASEILERIAAGAKSKKPEAEKSTDEKEKEILAQLVTLKSEEIEELRNEQQLLRVLASNALTIASFTHELRNIEKNLVNRVDDVEKQFKEFIPVEMYKDLARHLNPFTLLKDIRNEDVKLKEWLNYSLGTLRKDKRRRRNLDLHHYFDVFQRSWQAAFKSRGITFNVILPKIDQMRIRAFEIDLDCVLNNLLTNSMEAFTRKDAPYARNINIELQASGNDLTIYYRDSGPGLSKDITDPQKIFEPHFTTKKDAHSGEDIGTGLGMWLVKAFIEDNKGTIDLLLDKPGFGLKIQLPNKLKGKA